MGCTSRIGGDSECHFEACSVVNESSPSSVVDLLSLTKCGMEVMSKPSLVEVHVCALDSTSSSSDKLIEKLESQIASKKLELDVDTAEVEPTMHRLGFAEDAVSFILEQDQSQRHNIFKVKAAHVEAKAAQTSVGPTFSRLLHRNRFCETNSASRPGSLESLEKKSPECVNRATLRRRTSFLGVMAYKFVSA